MAVDLEAGLGDRGGDQLFDVAAVEVRDGAAARADHVVTMIVAGQHVAVKPGGVVDAVEHAELDEEVERAEDRCSTSRMAMALELAPELFGRERPGAGEDSTDDQPAGLGNPQPVLLDPRDDLRFGQCHVQPSILDYTKRREARDLDSTLYCRHHHPPGCLLPERGGFPGRGEDDPSVLARTSNGEEYEMQIELGKPVVSKDSERVGRVDRIALDYDTHEVKQIIVHQGILLTRDRIVDRDLIERVEDDGTVRLAITAAEVERLPEFVEAEFIRPTEEDLRSLPYILPGIPGATGAAILWAPPADRQPIAERPYQEFDPASGPLLGPAAPPETTIEVESNLPEDALLISHGTDVIDREGEKLGIVEEVETNEDGEVVAIVVRAGLLFHHDIRVPIDWVSSITEEAVHLRLSADEVEALGQAG